MTQEQYNHIRGLYDGLRDRMLKMACKNMNNYALAEEAVHDAFTIACDRPNDILRSPDPEGWLITALYYIMHNTLRSQEAGRRLLREYLLPRAKELSITEDNLDLKLLFGNVANMDEFTLIMEMAVYGLTYKEMAEKRGINIPACRKRVERAKKILQKKIKKDVTK